MSNETFSGAITDPSLLEKLNAGMQQPSAPTTGTPERRRDPLPSGAITDADLLDKLNTTWQADSLNPHSMINKIAFEGLGGEETDSNTWSSWTKTGSGIATSIAASIPAGKKGYAWGKQLVEGVPPVGWFGVVKGATPIVTGTLSAAFASGTALGATEFSHDAVEAVVTGEEFNPTLAFDEAWDAAQTDMLMSSAFGLGFPAVAKTYRTGKEIVGKMRPKRTLISGKAGLGDESINQVAKLQAQLRELGGSLMPSMVTDKALPKLAEQIARVSKFTKGTVERYYDIYGQFMGKQIDEMNQLFKNASPRKQGQVLQAFIAQNEQALAKIVDPLYKGLAIRGKGVVVNARKEATALAKELKNQYRAQPKLNPKTGQLEPQFVYKGGVKKHLDYLSKLPDDLNFYEAHQRLSLVKKEIDDILGSSSKDSNSLEVLNKTRDLLQKSMDNAAEKLNPALRKEYKEVTDYYAKGRQVVGSEWLKSAMKTNDPAKIGRMLTQDGLSEGVIQIKELRKLAAQFKKDLPKPPKDASKVELTQYKEMLKNLSKDPLEGIRRGFLDEILRTSREDAIPSAARFQEKLKNPRFRETFQELFKGTPVTGKMDELLENLSILQRSDKSQQGFQLTIAQAEQSVVTKPSIVELIKSSLPAFVSSGTISGKNIDRLISLQKVAIEAQKQGKGLPPAYYKSLEQLMGRGVIGGTLATPIVEGM